MSFDPITALVFVLGLALLGTLLAYVFLKAPAGTVKALLIRFTCFLRQAARRWTWGYLFIAGLLLYPIQIAWQAHRAAAGLLGDERLSAQAAALAKVVDPDQVYSKMSLAVGVFCLVNLLAWGALNLAFDVLTNWAKGGYADAERAAGVGMPGPVVGFKRTFLGLEPLPRLVIYFLFFALEVYAAAQAIDHAFRIQ